MKKIIDYQHKVLETLKGRMNDFYLAGGTALSLFYFQHRLSVDLDFFTQDFSAGLVKEIIEYLGEALKKEIKLIGQNEGKNKTARMMVYNIGITSSEQLKIDFVEDFIKLIKKPREVEGIKILSLEDIYLRKIYAVAGIVRIIEDTGRAKFLGGRTEAKDFYDLYCLSHTFMPLSKLVNKYCDASTAEALIRWFRTYDRMGMMDGLLSLDTDKKIDAKSIERHFMKEIDKIIEEQIGP